MGSKRSTYQPRVEYSSRSSVDMGRLGAHLTTADEKESRDCSYLIASYLAADRARSFGPAAGMPSSSSAGPASKPSRLSRFAARLKGKPSAGSAGPQYTNCADISPYDSHSLRSANFHHENFGELEAWAAAHDRGVNLSTAEEVRSDEKVAAWLDDLERFETWGMADPNEPMLDELEIASVLGERKRRFGDVQPYEGCCGGLGIVWLGCFALFCFLSPDLFADKHAGETCTTGERVE